LSIRFVYTERVDDRPIVWDAANRRHLGSDHPEPVFPQQRSKKCFATWIESRSN
jgi:hypothetical protein